MNNTLTSVIAVLGLGWPKIQKKVRLEDDLRCPLGIEGFAGTDGGVA
jgi:hypothetical protein